MTREKAYKLIELCDFVGDNGEALIPSLNLRLRVFDLLNTLKVDLTVALKGDEDEIKLDENGMLSLRGNVKRQAPGFCD